MTGFRNGGAYCCYLCGGNQYEECPGEVRDNSELGIVKCAQCGLVSLSSTAHIMENFYENSGMHEQRSGIDIDSWLRETSRDDSRRFSVLQNNIENKAVLDVGCGNGGFLFHAETAALSVAGVEPDTMARNYISRRNVPVCRSLEELVGSFDLITAFHVLEHVANPRDFLSRLANRLEKDGQIIVETPNADDALLSVYKCKPFSRFTYWSCHIYLYTHATLAALAKQAGLTINYIKQVQRYPLSNHMYWLANGRPSGHTSWSFLDSGELHAAYEKQLASIGACDTLLASFSKMDESL